MFQPVNLESKLVNLRTKSLKNEDILEWVKSIFEEDEIKRVNTLSKLSNSENNDFNIFNIERVDSGAIFHISHIKKLCIDYRLRFLDTKYFKGNYPEEAISKIHKLEQEHKTVLSGFKIAAPSILFKLKKADDPLLFAPMGNGYYYLIHKWGNDLHPLRKFKYWGIKSVFNFAVLFLILSVIFTILTHTFFFREHTSILYAFILFMFYFKGMVGFGLYFGIASGKNFSKYSWQSKYDKIC